MALRDLKFFDNWASRNKSNFAEDFSQKSKKRLEAELLYIANEYIKGRVTHMCVEVSNAELPLMLEVIQSERVSAILIVRQTEIPTQFILAFRPIESLV